MYQFAGIAFLVSYGIGQPNLVLDAWKIRGADYCDINFSQAALLIEKVVLIGLFTWIAHQRGLALLLFLHMTIGLH